MLDILARPQERAPFARKGAAPQCSQASAVRARAPLRLGLAGGGTDLPAYANIYGGAVVNATIDRYAHATVSLRGDGLVVFEAQDLGREETHWASASLLGSNLPLHRGVYERMVRDFNGGAPLAVRVTTSVDVPLGSGLGASSALTVALVQAYARFLRVPMAPEQAAHLACVIERTDLRLPGGRQDQYAAALGGVNALSFVPDGRILVEKLPLSRSMRAELEASLLICFSGQSRSSERIICEQSRHVALGSGDVLAAMHRMKALVADTRRALRSGDLSGFAAALDASWLEKKRLSPRITFPNAEALESLARREGAVAAKVSGAGGGGFMMFVAPPDRRSQLQSALGAAGCPALPVTLTTQGAACRLHPEGV